MDEKDGLLQDLGDESSSQQWKPNANRAHGPTNPTRLSTAAFLEFCKNEVPTECAFGLAQLALLYALINNTVGNSYHPV